MSCDKGALGYVMSVISDDVTTSVLLKDSQPLALPLGLTLLYASSSAKHTHILRGRRCLSFLRRRLTHPFLAVTPRHLSGSSLLQKGTEALSSDTICPK